MKIDLTRPPQIVFFILVLPALSMSLAYLSTLFFKPFSGRAFSFLIDGLGGIGAYGLLFSLFDRFAWKWRIFSLMRVINFPILRGRWEGEIESSFFGTEGKGVPAILEIRQSFSTIHADMYFEKSSSSSIMADFAHEPNGQLALHWEYQNDPNVKAGPTMHIHYGVARLNHSLDDNSLRGSYYSANSHGRGHAGSMNFRFLGKQLIGRFR